MFERLKKFFTAKPIQGNQQESPYMGSITTQELALKVYQELNLSDFRDKMNLSLASRAWYRLSQDKKVFPFLVVGPPRQDIEKFKKDYPTKKHIFVFKSLASAENFAKYIIGYPKANGCSDNPHIYPAKINKPANTKFPTDFLRLAKHTICPNVVALKLAMEDLVAIDCEHKLEIVPTKPETSIVHT